MKNSLKKIILAFSGGLDTSFLVPYLSKKGYQVITVTVNLGGFSKADLKKIAKKSQDLGAIKHYEVDGQAELYKNFANYLIKATYLKGGVYPACVGPERIIIAEKMSDIAKKHSINFFAHGSTGAGNDQVRMDIALMALNPNCHIITPIRDKGFTRKQELAHLKKWGFQVDETSKDYSINTGLIGTTIGGKETLDTLKELPDHAFPKAKGSKSDKIIIKFQQGSATHLNDQELPGSDIVKKLNQIGLNQDFGNDYHIGTTIIGLKGKIGFQAPGIKILIKAISELQKITLSKKQLFWKQSLGQLYGDLIHDGLYFDPIVKNLESFLDSLNKFVTGEVEIKIKNGQLITSCIKSPYSLFNSKIGKYGEENSFYSGSEAKGFCKLYGLESINCYLTQQT